jgi:Zn-dependent protease with chaperone function
LDSCGGFVVFLALLFGAIGAVIGFSSDATFSQQFTISLVAGGIAAAIGLVIAVISVPVEHVDRPRHLRWARSNEARRAGPVSHRRKPEHRLRPADAEGVVIEDSAPNAFATGMLPGHAHVAATRGLLDKLEKRELEAVMAHEVSHVGNYDTRLMTLVAVMVGPRRAAV